jgi:hypothetical protein
LQSTVAHYAKSFISTGQSATAAAAIVVGISALFRLVPRGQGLGGFAGDPPVNSGVDVNSV